MTETFSVLDPHQLRRIEAVHRGFLYQHLYAAGCLLQSGAVGATAVVVERDEDVEVVLPDRRIYVQVKTRHGPLIPSDVQGALDRFAAIRKAHGDGARPGDASFLIVSNVAPGPTLGARLGTDAWPPDVAVRWPGHDGASETAVPPAWADTSRAVAWCAQQAAALPFGLLAPETLVWKLAGRVLLAASGTGPQAEHAFATADLPGLFEQLVLQLQDFPAAPAKYRPQAGEPELASERRVRFIAGFSGAGKTSWASQAALALPGAAAYFDVGDAPGASVPVSLARELAARLFGKAGGRLGEILLPGASGLEILRALDLRLARDGLDVTVVVDNAHRVPAGDLRALVASASHLRFVFLGQPGPVAGELHAVAGVVPETLGGWTADTVAAEAADAGCRADYATCDRLLALTGALPLFVQSAIRVAAAQYAGELSRFCADLEAQTHVTATAQELILARLYGSLSPAVQDIAAALSVSDVPLSRAEAETLADAAVGLRSTIFAQGVRALAATGAAQLFWDQRIKVHDALRIVARAHLEGKGPEVVRSAHAALREILSASLRRERDLPRLALLIRTLSAVGDVGTLVDLATEEFFHELGFSRDLWGVLEEASSSPDLGSEERFWALDALLFADLKEGGGTKVPLRLEAMARLIGEGGLGSRERLSYLMKRMVHAARERDRDTVSEALAEGLRIVPEEPDHLRVFRYNSAHAFYNLGDCGKSVEITEDLINEYYDALGIKLDNVIMKNQQQIWDCIKKTSRTGDHLKHLADCLDIYAKSKNKLGYDAGLARIHALKFYALAHALDSLLRVGQDLVDEFVHKGDYIGAREVIEDKLLPLLREYKLVSRMVPLRSQYAVVLAYCGDHAGAAAEMTRLTPYELGLDDAGRGELRAQRQLVERLRVSGPQSAAGRGPRPVRRVKVGRNDACPCGSGRKYKRCHGG